MGDTAIVQCGSLSTKPEGVFKEKAMTSTNKIEGNGVIKNYIDIKAKFPQAKGINAISDISEGDVLCNHPDLFVVATKEIIERFNKEWLPHYFIVANVGKEYICKADVK